MQVGDATPQLKPGYAQVLRLLATFAVDVVQGAIQQAVAMGAIFNAFEAGSGARTGIEKWIAYCNAERSYSTQGIFIPDEAYVRKMEPMRVAA